jgi:hypothetical protein
VSEQDEIAKDQEQTAKALLLKSFKPCGHVGCIREGLWVPKVCVYHVGTTAVEKQHKLLITMYLCDMHKQSLRPFDLLTERGREDMNELVLRKYKKKINWDTIYLEFVHKDEINRILQ